jgi:hypothetical protein
VIVDTSPQPARFAATLMDPRVHYLHLPDRRRLETLPRCWRALGRRHVIASCDELTRRIAALRATECDRIRLPDDFVRPTIGEGRNLAAAVARELFDGEVVISHKDDDDFYHPGYLEFVATAMRDADWVKIRSFMVHLRSGAHAGRFGLYDYERRHGPVILIEEGREESLERYTVYADAANSQPAEWGEAPFFGLLFNYSVGAWAAAGGFFPLNRAEDIHFYRCLVRSAGERRLRLALVDAPSELVCRIHHTRSQRTLLHAFLPEPEVPAVVRAGVEAFRTLPLSA